MHSYIFTEKEVEHLLEWLKEGEETSLTTKTLSRIRQNADRLSIHLDIMLLCLKKMSREGRLMGRPRLPSKLESRLKDLMQG